MKKLVLLVVISFASAITITSCTEEAVHPQTENGNGGGGGTQGEP